MKMVNKITVALIALFCMGNLGAHTWTFINNTNETLVLKFGLQGHPHWYYNIVKPGYYEKFALPTKFNKVEKFTFGGTLGGLCFHSVQWAKYDPNMKVNKAQTEGQIETQNGGLDVQENLRSRGITMAGPEFGHLPYKYQNPEDIDPLPGIEACKDYSFAIYKQVVPVTNKFADDDKFYFGIDK